MSLPLQRKASPGRLASSRSPHLLGPLVPNAQQKPPTRRREAAAAGQEIDEDEVLRIDTDLVLVDVLVTDAEGRPVRGLRPEDFKIYEDGVERPVAFFNVERRGGAERPVAVVFLIDVSGSMTAAEMERVRLALDEFARGSRRGPASFARGLRMSAKSTRIPHDRAKLTVLHAPGARAERTLPHTYDAWTTRSPLGATRRARASARSQARRRRHEASPAANRPPETGTSQPTPPA